MKIGDNVLFGDFTWKVLDVKENKVLVITEEIIEQRDYHSKSVPITWADCELRKYLNEDFYNKFSEKDKSRIVPTTNKNTGNIWYKTDGGVDTVDSIFILSINDVVRSYFGDSSKLLDYPGKIKDIGFREKIIITSIEAHYLKALDGGGGFVHQVNIIE